MNRRSFIGSAISQGVAWLSFGLLPGCGYDESPERNRLRKIDKPLSKENSRDESGQRKNDDAVPEVPTQSPDGSDNSETTPPLIQDPAPTVEYIEFYPLYAMATYFDGSLGPVTAEITSVQMTNEMDEELMYWHGHGGRSHTFTLSKFDKNQILGGRKVVIETSTVDGHTHKLFIDPTDKQWRIVGAEMVKIPRKKEGKS